MLPQINLDDRKFDDIKDEAVSLIPRYCPEWTNRNISDPGMTLLSLFSWMTEMTLHRINRIPEKTYIALLDLLGFTLKPPKCASTVLKFFFNPNRERDIPVPEGTRVGSVGGNGPPVVFETESSIVVRNIELISCYNRDGEKWDKIDINEDGNIDNFLLFDSQNSVTHEIYFGSPAISNILLGHTIEIEFDAGKDIASQKDEAISYIKWEYFDGNKWVSYTPSYSYYKKANDKPNTVYFSGIYDIAPCTIGENSEEGYYFKAILVDYPDMSVSGSINPFSIKAMKLKVLYTGDGFAPDLMLNCSRKIYSEISQGNVFKIFTDEPAYDESFYFVNNDIFSHSGLKVNVFFTLGDGNNDNIQSNALAEFPLEYFDGDRWKKVADGYEDGTAKFTKSGKLSFNIPKDIVPCAVDNRFGYWFRVRIVTQNMGSGGKFVTDEETGVTEWKFDAKVQSPLFERIRIEYEPFDRYFTDIIQYSNFKWKSFPYLCSPHESKKETILFDINKEELPSLYLGFNKAVSVGTFPIFFKVDEIGTKSGQNAALSSFFLNGENEESVNIEWQTWTGTKWEEISVTDNTNSFSESGFIYFSSNGDMKETQLFDDTAYWIRAIKVNGNFTRVPTVKSIMLNCVKVVNQSTHRNEELTGYDSSTNSYSVANNRILPGVDVLVCENDKIPTNDELRTMSREGVKECYIQDGDRVWVRYREVGNFYNSNSFSRHFVVDYKNSRIVFGDGKFGLNPHEYKYKVKILKYSTGGGKYANVAAHKLQYLSTSIPFIDGCDNPFPAEGGSDIETLTDLKGRASGLIKSLERAVTPEDYEWLAKEATPAVGKAYCCKQSNNFGEAKIIIIPTSDVSAGFDFKLTPSKELIKQVKNFLNDRKVIGTTVSVEGPVYRSFNVKIILVFKNNYFDYEAEEARIANELRRFFHPLYGSEDFGGWRVSTSVSVASIMKRLEGIESIQRTLSVSIYDVERNLSVEEIQINEYEMPYMNDIQIEERMG